MNTPLREHDPLLYVLYRKNISKKANGNIHKVFPILDCYLVGDDLDAIEFGKAVWDNMTDKERDNFTLAKQKIVGFNFVKPAVVFKKPLAAIPVIMAIAK